MRAAGSSLGPGAVVGSGFRFVETRWKPEVVDFLEIDYVPFVPA